MKIGLTYDLRQDYLDMGYSEAQTAELDAVETVAGIEDALHTLGHETVRIGRAKKLVDCLSKGQCWDLVFNICEGLHGIGRESQVPAILELYEIPYTFSDPVVMGVCLHKGMTKQIVRAAGLNTAEFLVARQPEDAASVNFDPPFFIKPVAEGTGMGVTSTSVVNSRAELEWACRFIIKTFHQPALIESFLPGREFTVGLAGTGAHARVLGAMEILFVDRTRKPVYSLENKEGWKGRVAYQPLGLKSDSLAEEVHSLALKAWQTLDCRDAGRIDIRCDGLGRPTFIEVNPLAGLRPDYSDLPLLCHFFQISYVQLIEMILYSASKRIKWDKQL